MTASGVTRMIQRGERLVLTGQVRARAPGEAPRSVALRLSDMTLAETTPVRDGGEADLWTFRFVLAAGLQALLAAGVPLAVMSGAVEIPFAAKAQAKRSAVAAAPDFVREVTAKLRDGFVLTSKGELREPFAVRDAGLAAILDHYEHCDRLVHDMLGRHLHAVGGTFLGAARDGRAIDHDVDFDAAYLSDARDAATLKTEYLAFLGELFRRGEDVRIVNHVGHIRRRHFKWRSHAAAAEIDVFPAYIDAEGYYCRPTFVRIPGGEGLINPLRRTRFGDREVWAPNRMVEKAERVFGASWRTADPFWKKPKFPGVDEALSGLTLSDDDLLALSAEMPPELSGQLRAALAARHAAEAARSDAAAGTG
ncbi:hypothetical protein [Methylopila sp. M107]|uniref:hypothetical protein n=1 Tax=Methylopila sp. M107 TaxID=1101190 RepID=UPI00037926B5|nr:hypothetical protein [Methylopila sp. M107]